MCLFYLLKPLLASFVSSVFPAVSKNKYFIKANKHNFEMSYVLSPPLMLPMFTPPVPLSVSTRSKKSITPPVFMNC